MSFRTTAAGRIIALALFCSIASPPTYAQGEDVLSERLSDIQTRLGQLEGEASGYARTIESMDKRADERIAQYIKSSEDLRELSTDLYQNQLGTLFAATLGAFAAIGTFVFWFVSVRYKSESVAIEMKLVDAERRLEQVKGSLEQAGETYSESIENLGRFSDTHANQMKLAGVRSDIVSMVLRNFSSSMLNTHEPSGDDIREPSNEERAEHYRNLMFESSILLGLASSSNQRFHEAQAAAGQGHSVAALDDVLEQLESVYEKLDSARHLEIQKIRMDLGRYDA